MPNFTLKPDFVFDRIGSEDAYYVSKILTVPADGSANVHMRNPHPDKDMWVVAIDVSVSGTHEIHMYDAFDSVTDGTEITPENALLDEGGGGGSAQDIGPFEAYYNSSYTPSNGDIPIGITESSSPSTTKISYFPTVLERDREIIIEIQNQKANQEKGLISLFVCTSY